MMPEGSVQTSIPENTAGDGAGETGNIKLPRADRIKTGTKERELVMSLMASS